MTVVTAAPVQAVVAAFDREAFWRVYDSLCEAQIRQTWIEHGLDALEEACATLHSANLDEFEYVIAPHPYESVIEMARPCDPHTRITLGERQSEKYRKQCRFKSIKQAKVARKRSCLPSKLNRLQAIRLCRGGIGILPDGKVKLTPQQARARRRSKRLTASRARRSAAI